MDNLNLIVAIGKNNELGKNNKLLWHLKEDMKFFKSTTTGKTVIMGRKTFESIGRPLPNRENIVLSRSNIYLGNDIKIMNSKEEVLEYIKNKDEVFIIGGEKIYRLFIDDVNEMLITEVEKYYDDADAFFPEFNKEDFDREIIKEVNDEEIKYSHVKYLRKKLEVKNELFN